MAWVRCCGGAPSVKYPIDLLNDYSWTPTSPTENYAYPARSTKTYTMVGRTPIINNNMLYAEIYNWYGSQIATKVDVSEDGNTWTTVLPLANTNPDYAPRTVSLSAYNGKQLYVRVIGVNDRYESRSWIACKALSIIG